MENDKPKISPEIENIIKLNCCIICGSYNEIICDFKNDLLNDERILNQDTQILDDFQPLCKGHYLQKNENL